MAFILTINVNYQKILFILQTFNYYCDIIKTVKEGKHRTKERLDMTKQEKMLLTEKEVRAIRDVLQRDYIHKMMWFQFRRCQAWTSSGYIQMTDVITDRLVMVQPIRSYDTIVGFVAISPDSNGNPTEEFYEVGKYSRTTSKQVTQIYNDKYSWYPRYYVNRV